VCDDVFVYRCAKGVGGSIEGESLAVGNLVATSECGKGGEVGGVEGANVEANDGEEKTAKGAGEDANEEGALLRC